MVKALHRAGIEVILDVVFNHTAEGDHDGPTFCFRGLANDAYYILEADRSRYANYTGSGNTLNANHPIVRRLILDSLRYWVDARCTSTASASTSPRSWRATRTASRCANPPVLWDIESDPALAGTKLIAEAWDAAGLYQVGSFVGDAWTGVERPVPRRRAQLRQGRSGHRAARSRRGCSAAPTSTATRSARPSRASTSSPATTASR